MVEFTKSEINQIVVQSKSWKVNLLRFVQRHSRFSERKEDIASHWVMCVALSVRLYIGLNVGCGSIRTDGTFQLIHFPRKKSVFETCSM